ncbi:alpha/beta fold hydrolase [Paraburkholderia acidisoli]|uniref:Alpha/beta fold hydrolase n=2 Tax=Paraburkholderia acidisoli TaxID=2571748 RepID=A0A7Z2GQ81_9BURK|nr:alpha/beta fold hydrolase [Paraburkholderia acidisoli]
MCNPLVFARSAAQTGLNAFALAWLEDEGAFDMASIANRIVEAVAGEGDIVIAGHSLGTPLAVLTTLAARGRTDLRVKGLVLSNSGANTQGHGDASAIVRRIEQEWGEPMWKTFAERCFHTLPQGALLDEILAYPARLRSGAVAQAIRSQIETDLLPVLSQLPALPVAVVHGEYDVARTLAHARELSGAIAGASLHVLPTGHTSCAEDPLAFADIARAVAVRAVSSARSTR